MRIVAVMDNLLCLMEGRLIIFLKDNSKLCEIYRKEIPDINLCIANHQVNVDHVSMLPLIEGNINSREILRCQKHCR